MYQLSQDVIAMWRQDRNHKWLPGALEIACPHCHRHIMFSTAKWYASTYGIYLTRANCPACDKVANFMLVNHVGDRDRLADTAQFFIYPSPQMRDLNLDIVNNDSIDETAKSAYRAIVRVFNTAEWSATLALIQQLMSTVLISELKKDNDEQELQEHINISEVLERLTKSRDFGDPLMQLSEAFKDDGTFWEFFELKREPDAVVTSLFVDLLDAMMSYIFVLPNRIEGILKELQSEVELSDDGFVEDEAELVHTGTGWSPCVAPLLVEDEADLTPERLDPSPAVDDEQRQAG